ncbi:MAG: zinc-ribbon protein [Podoviridae sp. ctviO18]|nr:MAG: zinc-ribbon protein [Podoviridae sp. ctviO18]
MEEIKCPKCEESKWKTLVKKQAWECRNCHFIKGEYHPPVKPTVFPKLEVSPLRPFMVRMALKIMNWLTGKYQYSPRANYHLSRFNHYL